VSLVLLSVCVRMSFCLYVFVCVHVRVCVHAIVRECVGITRVLQRVAVCCSVLQCVVMG